MDAIYIVLSQQPDLCYSVANKHVQRTRDFHSIKKKAFLFPSCTLHIPPATLLECNEFLIPIQTTLYKNNSYEPVGYMLSVAVHCTKHIRIEDSVHADDRDARRLTPGAKWMVCADRRLFHRRTNSWRLGFSLLQLFHRGRD